MNRIIYAVVLLLAWTASVASAGSSGINIAWDACGPTGMAYKTFACNSDIGTAEFFVSFAPPGRRTDLMGLWAHITVVDLVSHAAVPSWWDLAPGGCRGGSLIWNWRGATTGGCAAYNAAWSDSLFEYVVNQWGEGSVTALLRSDFPIATAMEQDVEYFAFRFAVDYARSAGADSCAGCRTGLTIRLDHLDINWMSGTGDDILTAALRQTSISWQGGPLVPARSATWGQIKSLYR